MKNVEDGTQFVFQSTLPVRGATKRAQENFRVVLFQSTLPVRGATKPLWDELQMESISIHAPRAGSDWNIRQGCPG